MSARPLIGRETIVFALLFFLGGIFLFTLFKRQILEHNTFAQESENQSVRSEEQIAERGSIFAQDRNGKLYQLAANEWRYELLVSPRQIKDKQKTLSIIKKYIPTIDEPKTLEQMNSKKVYVPPVHKNIEAATARKLATEGLAGIYLKPKMVRVYPEGEKIAPQILGFVGADSLGKYGVEAIYDAKLRGQSGSEKAKRDSLGRLIDILSQDTATPGADIILTIDYNLQYFVEQRLTAAIEGFQAEKGSVVVMNPKNGAILAAAGRPVFDPNNYNLLSGEDQRRYLFAGASDVYEAGSVVKPITMAMAINEGLVEPTTSEIFGKSVKVLDKEIFNAENKVYGRETMTQVLENSDNVAMVWLAQKIGQEKQREYLTRFGFGSKTGVDLLGEQSGSIHEKKDWNALLQATAAFGQGFSTTVVQIAEAYSVVANGGNRVTPHFVESFRLQGANEKNDVAFGEQIINGETAAKVREMLNSVVERGHGKRAKVQGIKVGGKTGTAQVADPAGGYAKDKHIGTFAGLFPIDDPKFVMVVRLDNPKLVNFAESSAAPVFGEIAEWIATYYQLR